MAGIAVLYLLLYVSCSLNRTFTSPSETWKNGFSGARVQNMKLMIARKKLLITATETVLHIAG